MLGLGLMGMSEFYGPAAPEESLTTIRGALDAGVTLLDTGDFYGMGHGELLVAEALAGRDRSAVTLSVKYGALRTPEGGWAGIDTRPAATANFLGYSLRRLRTDHVDVYRPSRLDPAVPIEETVGALAELVKAGHVRHIGLSEVGPETLRRAHAVHPVCDVQIEYSLFSRGVERRLLPVARELGVGITAYGVLSRGLLSGAWSSGRTVSPGDFRGYAPRFQGQHLAHNLALVEALRPIAQARSATVAQLVVAWVASRGADVVPLVGARTPAQLADVLGAADLTLTADELAAVEAAVPADAAAGSRYPDVVMHELDSER
ncbi:aldo/keto reductase [Pseudonocardia sp. CNS-139]|nr:aldo/keto reductase [Pseudonocardia sp. CNS-139]